MSGENVFDGAPDGRQSGDQSLRPSRFRPCYRALSAEEKALHDEIKAKAEELEALMARVAASPEQNYSEVARYNALAQTALEQSVMWSIKALTS